MATPMGGGCSSTRGGPRVAYGFMRVVRLRALVARTTWVRTATGDDAAARRCAECLGILTHMNVRRRGTLPPTRCHTGRSQQQLRPCPSCLALAAMILRARHPAVRPRQRTDLHQPRARRLPTCRRTALHYGPRAGGRAAGCSATACSRLWPWSLSSLDWSFTGCTTSVA
jgi:hypothetical protein